MVPLRFIGEAFGALVTWDPVFQIIDIELRGLPIRLQLGANYASVAGKKVILQGIPVNMKGTTMVPIRFIGEAFGAQVAWNAPTQGIDITYPKP
jgi:N-acetylmuramoyl-L-alanine amidase